METIPVIAVAFGTSTEARDTYAFFEECFRAMGPSGRIMVYGGAQYMSNSARPNLLKIIPKFSIATDETSKPITIELVTSNKATTATIRK